MDCARAVASFDPNRAVERLPMSLNGYMRLPAATLLVELGDARGIPALIEQARQLDAGGRLAVRVLRRYTQEDIGNDPFDPDRPAGLTRSDVDEWAQWWQRVGSTFVVKTRAAHIDSQCCAF